MPTYRLGIAIDGLDGSTNWGRVGAKRVQTGETMFATTGLRQQPRVFSGRACVDSNMHPSWVPILDGLAGFRRNSQLGRGLPWFERRGIYAARVLNASTMGSQFKRVIFLILLTQSCLVGQEHQPLSAHGCPDRTRTLLLAIASDNFRIACHPARNRRPFDLGHLPVAPFRSRVPKAEPTLRTEAPRQRQESQPSLPLDVDSPLIVVEAEVGQHAASPPEPADRLGREDDRPGGVGRTRYSRLSCSCTVDLELRIKNALVAKYQAVILAAIGVAEPDFRRVWRHRRADRYVSEPTNACRHRL